MSCAGRKAASGRRIFVLGKIFSGARQSSVTIAFRSFLPGACFFALALSRMNMIISFLSPTVIFQKELRTS